MENNFLEKMYGIKDEKLKSLKKIGGHKVYHLEGDAYKHTMKVVEAVGEIYHGLYTDFFSKLAILHDIGKIFTSVRGEDDNDWTYPGHAKAGAEHLAEFLVQGEKDKDYLAIKWFIANHIKPLFWKDKDPVELRQEFDKIMKFAPKGDPRCTLNNLRILAIADIMGSEPVDKDQKNRDIQYLRNLVI